jgi:hypothetical protein
MTETINLGDAIRKAKREAVAKKRSAWYRQYYLTHIDEMQERRRVYYRQNRDRISNYNRSYYHLKKMRQLTVSSPVRQEAVA